jgi:hypothetical protein
VSDRPLSLWIGAAIADLIMLLAQQAGGVAADRSKLSQAASKSQLKASKQAAVCFS